MCSCIYVMIFFFFFFWKIGYVVYFARFAWRRLLATADKKSRARAAAPALRD